jgi:hypothetical protein
MRPTSFREFWEYTVEKVAVNAVMAGAKPEYFSVILALASAGFALAQWPTPLSKSRSSPGTRSRRLHGAVPRGSCIRIDLIVEDSLD